MSGETGGGAGLALVSSFRVLKRMRRKRRRRRKRMRRKRRRRRRRRESHACYGFVENRGQITLTRFILFCIL